MILGAHNIKKDENETLYQLLSLMNEDKLKQYVNTYLVQEQDILDVSFFEILPADIKSIRVVDSTRHNFLKAYDEATDFEVDFSISSR